MGRAKKELEFRELTGVFIYTLILSLVQEFTRLVKTSLA